IVSAWDETLTTKKQPLKVGWRTPLGPEAYVPTSDGVYEIPADELPQLLSAVRGHLTSKGQLPNVAEVKAGVVALADLLPTLAAGFKDGLEVRSLPLVRGAPALAARVDENLARACWSASDLPGDFSAPKQVEFARNQLWTYKPAFSL
ncbi:MAG: hypothetical protein ACRC1K_18915, partial [Planctomycetia bacterium]